MTRFCLSVSEAGPTRRRGGTGLTGSPALSRRRRGGARVGVPRAQPRATSCSERTSEQRGTPPRPVFLSVTFPVCIRLYSVTFCFGRSSSQPPNCGERPAPLVFFGPWSSSQAWWGAGASWRSVWHPRARACGEGWCLSVCVRRNCLPTACPVQRVPR